jgi:hypothetical protein
VTSAEATVTASNAAHDAPSHPFTHLTRLTDDTGLLEHARHATPRREHGYCTDDVARGLVVTSRAAGHSPEALRLSECYLAFLTHAQDLHGAFHNRLGFHRSWTDQPGLGDWWGRALWGLGTAAGRSPAPWIRAEAGLAFTRGAARRSAAPRAMAFAALGAAELLRVDPGNEAAAALLSDAATAIGQPAADPGWLWPHERLTYANAVLAEAVIAAGDLLGEPVTLDAGLRMLQWLLDIQTLGGHLSVVPSTGWGRGEPRPRHDQQPIEVATLADACATAATITGADVWRRGLQSCIDWFLGDNDLDAVMWDRATGGGYDGLTPHGPNLNQGAESTLALIATLQHRRSPSAAPSGGG